MDQTKQIEIRVIISGLCQEQIKSMIEEYKSLGYKVVYQERFDVIVFGRIQDASA